MYVKPDATFFRFDSDRAQLQIFAASVEGIYNITLNLTDNNKDAPGHTNYTFFVLVQERNASIVEEEKVISNTVVIETEYDDSFIYLSAIDRKGQITVSFSKPMQVPDQSVIDELYSSGKVKFIVRPFGSEQTSKVSTPRELQGVTFNNGETVEPVEEVMPAEDAEPSDPTATTTETESPFTHEFDQSAYVFQSQNRPPNVVHSDEIELKWRVTTFT